MSTREPERDTKPRSERDLLQKEAEAARVALRNTVRSMGTHLGAAVSPPGWVKEFPWTSLAVAGAAGLAVGFSLGPDPRRKLARLKESRRRRKAARRAAQAASRRAAAGTAASGQSSASPSSTSTVEPRGRWAVLLLLGQGLRLIQAFARPLLPLIQNAMSRDGSSARDRVRTSA